MSQGDSDRSETGLGEAERVRGGQEVWDGFGQFEKTIFDPVTETRNTGVVRRFRCNVVGIQAPCMLGLWIVIPE